MNSKKHSQFTGEKAIINKKVLGKFSVFDGWASGQNLELIKEKKIVQSWRAAEWEEGHFSKIIIQLEKTPEGTKVTFTHENVPEEFKEDIAKGWDKYYWKPLKNFLEK